MDEVNYSPSPDTSHDWSVPLTSSDQCLADAENARQHPHEGWNPQQAFNMCEQPYRPQATPEAPAPKEVHEHDWVDTIRETIRNFTDPPDNPSGPLPPPAPVVGSPECQRFADNNQGPPGSPWNHDQLVKMCEKSKANPAPAAPYDHMAD
jgi:hypothetical protein